MLFRDRRDDDVRFRRHDSGASRRGVDQRHLAENLASPEGFEDPVAGQDLHAPRLNHVKLGAVLSLAKNGARRFVLRESGRRRRAEG